MAAIHAPRYSRFIFINNIVAFLASASTDFIPGRCLNVNGGDAFRPAPPLSDLRAVVALELRPRAVQSMRPERRPIAGWTCLGARPPRGGLIFGFGRHRQAKQDFGPGGQPAAGISRMAAEPSQRGSKRCQKIVRRCHVGSRRQWRTYKVSTLARAQGVRRRNWRLDLTLGLYLKQRISTARAISGQPQHFTS